MIVILTLIKILINICTLRILQKSQGVKSTCFEAEVSIGGPGVSIRGVRS